MGEKFSTNPVTGTGSVSVPVLTTPGRSGFGPQLSLTYDSGSGNGIFGFGWNISLPSITRKTDKGIPKYNDSEESDVFNLSGAEDLVPVGSSLPRDSYSVTKYRPRTEGLFARIEKWTDKQTGDSYWQSISKDNITTIYGKDSNSRIYDPDDPSRIFCWLICESYDNKGNAILYRYRDDDFVSFNPPLVHERNRTSSVRATNRYLQNIFYGNIMPYLRNDTPKFVAEFFSSPVNSDDWLFEVVFDYARSDTERPHDWINPVWDIRRDPFSSYRSGFEVRTYRLCHRILMFHHFPKELGVRDYLVRSLDFIYAESPIASFITAVTQSSYLLDKAIASYKKKSLPPLEFEYSKAEIQETPGSIYPEDLGNLPVGLDGSQYQWVDLDGEGISGILSEQGDAWHYKPNLGRGRFGEMRAVGSRPATANLSGGSQQLMDLAGDGSLDLVEFGGLAGGFYERTPEGGWEPFRSFLSLPNIPWNNPNLKFTDLNGDGHADVLVAESETLSWYPSLAEDGFGHAERVYLPSDEEKGPHLLFADGTQSVYLADLSGDGLSDLVRIQNGEVCYWPNVGYGKFGAKVTMDNSPIFDTPDLFDQRRIRLADIDGSGTTDILYLRHDRVDVYFNECGNSWSEPRFLTCLPSIDNLSSVTVVDLFGNGTACLVWSSPLPRTSSQQMSYVRLMGDHKPHLLIGTKNNMGAETRVEYESSTKFYLEDRAAGNPWVTRLPFPVHVLSRVEVYDRISRNLFITRYTYHHGYYDGIEREFRGFGRVEQTDTEEYGAMSRTGAAPDRPGTSNVDAASHVPPVVTKTWFHTGAYLEGDLVSLRMAHEYYGAPDPSKDDEFDAYLRTLLPDTILPKGLTVDEEREACRALRGSILRQEIYTRDGSPRESNPYSTSEWNYTVNCLQPRGTHRHAVFYVHPREMIDYHYERNPDDPRISHAMIFDVDDYGNVLKSVAIGYGRVHPDLDYPEYDPAKHVVTDTQGKTLITYTENSVTNSIDNLADPDNYLTPLPAESKTFELTGFYMADPNLRFVFDDFLVLEEGRVKIKDGHVELDCSSELNYERFDDINNAKRQKRLIEDVRILYRKNDLTGFLPLGTLESLAIPGETYKLAFTPGLLTAVYSRRQDLAGTPEDLLPDRNDILGTKGGYRDLDGNGHWWLPSGKIFLSSDPAGENAFAKSHFYLPHRFDDPFGNTTTLSYDTFCLQLVKTTDPLNNTVTANGLDYRVMQPSLITDPNGNRSAAAFDIFGMVAGTAVMGKDGENKGDTLDDFDPDPDFDAVIRNHLLNPTGTLPGRIIDPQDLLKGATTRIVYDLFTYYRIREDPEPQPNVVYTMTRETHHYDELETGTTTKIQHSFSYSDGFGREIQKKIQAEPGPVPARDSDGKIVVNADGTPQMTDDNFLSRWVGSGWTVFNNKGKPIRQYEPFFSDRHEFESDVRIGVSPVIFYDPVGRVVATLHPNHMYEKVVFDPWQQTRWDVNDTAALDPRNDADIQGYVAAYFRQAAPEPETWKTWLHQRIDPSLPPADSPSLDPERKAAIRTLAHAGTPMTAYSDSLGRTFLTVALLNTAKTEEGRIRTRIMLDIEGNQRTVTDALDRPAMKCDYDMLSNPIKQQSIDAGRRWMLNDVAGNPLFGWDDLNRTIRHGYDFLRRPTHLFVQEGSGTPQLAEYTIYGEMHPDSNSLAGNPAVQQLNLRGKIFLQLDGAGMVTNTGIDPQSLREEGYDFKGNLLRSTRRCAADYTKRPDWKDAEGRLKEGIESQPEPKIIHPDTLTTFLGDLQSLLEPFEYTGSTTYDALNRPVSLTTPDGSVTYHTYNEANLLETVSVKLRGSDISTQFVRDIDYNAKGQREYIEYGNGVKTAYEYDPLTFRLTRIYTVRGSGFSDDCKDRGSCEDPPRKCQKGRQDACGVQNLHYTDDPAGNIVHIRDDAQQTIYFSGSIVQPRLEFTYDAIYRLIEAKGREHICSAETSWTTWHDRDRMNLPQPGNMQQMRNYSEHYTYDKAGNIEEMKHSASNGNGTNPNNWTRSFTIESQAGDPSLKKSNRLCTTTVGKDASPNKATWEYAYDNHGNMVRLPHLQDMSWDFEDQLQRVRKIQEDEEDPYKGCIVYFTYDAGGQRVRKVMEQDGRLLNERFYVGCYEIYRKYNGNMDAILERESLHIMDDRQRIALIDTKTVDTKTTGSPLPETLIRYQLGNHMGSAVLELDEQAEVISYEEFYPHGSTSFQAMRSSNPGSVEVSMKRYRYTGKERDEETGLYYHGARYYAPWLGRWVSCDPAGIIDDLNLFTYAVNNPINFHDNTGMSVWDIVTLPTRMVKAVVKGAFIRGNLNTAVGAVVGLKEKIERTVSEIKEHPYISIPPFVTAGPFVGATLAHLREEAIHTYHRAEGARQRGGSRVLRQAIEVNKEFNPAVPVFQAADKVLHSRNLEEGSLNFQQTVMASANLTGFGFFLLGLRNPGGVNVQSQPKGPGKIRGTGGTEQIPSAGTPILSVPRVKIVSPVYLFEKRRVFIVETSLGNQAFSECTDPQPGKIVGRFYPFGEIQTGYNNYFMKPPTAESLGHPLQWFETLENKLISEALSKMDIPPGQEIPSGRVMGSSQGINLNRILDSFNARIYPRSEFRPVKF